MNLIYDPPVFLKKFIDLKTKCSDGFKLRGDNLLIEVLNIKERKTSGGIIMATKSDQRVGSSADTEAMFGVVLLTGTGFEGEPMDIETGNLVLLPRHSTEFYSFFPGLHDLTKDTLGRCSASEVKFFYKDLAAFERAQEVLN